MRKLGILVALTAAATLGIAGTASAQDLPVDVPVDAADGHEDTLCPNIHSENPVLNDENMAQDLSGGNGEPLNSALGGLEETCKTSNSTDGLKPSPTLCGTADGLDARGVPAVGDVVRQVNDGAAGQFPENPVVSFDACGGDDDNGGGGGNGNGSSVESAGTDPVQTANAAADGSMPRTGGELFAGAGFGLASLGALIRRFIG